MWSLSLSLSLPPPSIWFANISEKIWKAIEVHVVANRTEIIETKDLP